jgi:hypothetical protein
VEMWKTGASVMHMNMLTTWNVPTHHNMFSKHSQEHSLQLFGINILVQVCNLKYYWVITGYTAWQWTICSRPWRWNGMEVMLWRGNIMYIFKFMTLIAIILSAGCEIWSLTLREVLATSRFKHLRSIQVIYSTIIHYNLSP